MSHQPELFYEDIYDALRAAVQAAGGAKTVGHLLWPSLPVAEAHRALLDALNRDRARKLDPEETFRIFRLAREANFHNAFHFACEGAGYEKAPPIDPKQERNKAVEAVAGATDALRRALTILERVQAEPAVRVVK